MERVYLIIFLVGVLYTAVSFILGGVSGALHFGGHIISHFDAHFDAHMGGHIDSHIDGHAGGHDILPRFLTFPLKPITIFSFLTVFGGIGLIGTQKNFYPIAVFAIAFAAGIIVSTLIYKCIVVPLYKAQNTSAVSQNTLIGMKASVVSPILENGFGTICYVVNGIRHNAPAQHVNKKAVSQGQEVIIYLIKENVFYVEPLNDEYRFQGKSVV